MTFSNLMYVYEYVRNLKNCICVIVCYDQKKEENVCSVTCEPDIYLYDSRYMTFNPIWWLCCVHSERLM